MVDNAGLGWPAADDGEVVFSQLVALELAADLARAVGIEREQQHAGGALVEAMQGMHPPADLVAQQLHGEARFMAVDVAAVHQQSGGLVDGDQAVVAVENVEHVAQAADEMEKVGRTKLPDLCRIRSRRCYGTAPKGP